MALTEYRGTVWRMDFVTVASIEQEFPGWEAWQGIDRLWHARIRGATPPVMVWGEDLEDLRNQIVRKVSQQETEDYRRYQRPEGATL